MIILQMVQRIFNWLVFNEVHLSILRSRAVLL